MLFLENKENFQEDVSKASKLSGNLICYWKEATMEG
jgi:hypothetical protein